jgi:integrase
VSHYEKHRDIAGLASILGHSSINTTQIYTMVTAEEKAQEISALGLVVWLWRKLRKRRKKHHRTIIMW